jgi:hypothetical protein
MTDTMWHHPDQRGDRVHASRLNHASKIGVTTSSVTPDGLSPLKRIRFEKKRFAGFISRIIIKKTKIEKNESLPILKTISFVL